MDHGETDGRKTVDPDQDQWITGEQTVQMQARPGPSPMDQLGAHGQRKRKAEQGEGRWESKIAMLYL